VGWEGAIRRRLAHSRRPFDICSIQISFVTAKVKHGTWNLDGTRCSQNDTIRKPDKFFRLSERGTIYGLVGNSPGNAVCSLIHMKQKVDATTNSDPVRALYYFYHCPENRSTILVLKRKSVFRARRTSAISELIKLIDRLNVGNERTPTRRGL
jgi:hypothetical protein